MELKDNNLQKAIQYKVGKFRQEPIEQSDLDKIKELSLSDITFSR